MFEIDYDENLYTNLAQKTLFSNLRVSLMLSLSITLL